MTTGTELFLCAGHCSKGCTGLNHFLVRGPLVGECSCCYIGALEHRAEGSRFGPRGWGNFTEGSNQLGPRA